MESEAMDALIARAATMIEYGMEEGDIRTMLLAETDDESLAFLLSLRRGSSQRDGSEKGGLRRAAFRRSKRRAGYAGDAAATGAAEEADCPPASVSASRPK
jgi:hypothetical protein